MKQNDPANAVLLAKLRQDFVAELPARLAALQQRWQQLRDRGDQDRFDNLLRAVHDLTGTAGSLGLTAVCDAARRLELCLAVAGAEGILRADALGGIEQAFERLEQQVQAGLQSRSSSPRPSRPSRPQSTPLIHLMASGGLSPELADGLRLDGYRVREFSGLQDLDMAAASGDERPAALVLAMPPPESGATAVAGTREAEMSRLPADVPLVWLSERDDLAARLTALRAGARRFLATPVTRDGLVEALHDLTGRQPAPPCRVLLLDDDPLVLEIEAHVLRTAGMEVRTLGQPLQLLEALREFAPDVLVMDVNMPGASGPELAAVLRQHHAYDHLPILFASSETDMSRQLQALELGGDDFLVKPVQPEQLVAIVTARAQRARQHDAIRRRLQTALYEREREHLALNEHAIVSITDRAGNITYVNDRFCAISGYTRVELVGQNHRIVKSGQHPPAFYATLWGTISGGRVWQGELCNRRKDGRLYWVESTIVPFLDANGRPYQYVSIRTDITRIKTAEATIERQKERLRRGQLTANIGTWEWYIPSGELYWTERIAPLFGYPEGELETSYENFLKAVHPEDRQAVIDAVNAAVEHGAPYDIEHRVVWPDGTVRWLLEKGAVQRDAGGKPLQMLGVVQDIDDRKRAQLALAESRARLEEAQTLAKLGYWEADLVSGELHWSDEIYRIFGRDPAGYTPSVEAFFAAVHPEDLALVHASQQPGLHDVVHRIVRPDGEVRYVHELARYERDDNQQVVRLIGTVQDVTDLKRIEQALIIARDEAERANRAKTDFLSSMSHELRTPMNAILGFSQLMESDDTLPAEHRDNVREIILAGNHLLQLINEVLDLAKVESGRITLSLEPVEVNALVEESLKLVSAAAEQRAVSVQYTGLEGALVRADRTRLKQALLNLLSNAVKYNRENGRVEVTLQRTDERLLRIQVRDTGPGIPPAKLGELFQPFSRLGAEATDIEGTGIGLTITRRIVEMMGGRVDVHSEVGVGSTFWIDLPLELGRVV